MTAIASEYKSYSLIKTKLFVPKLRSAIIHRKRLTDKLDSGLEGRLTLACAPAGFGKTTLLVDWISKRSGSAAWISLDQAENDPVCFLKYITGALQTVEKNLGGSTLLMLNAFESSSIESITANLVNEISEFQTRLILVLDDFHVIDNPDVYKIVEFIIENMPENMHLAISSRMDSPFPITRLKVQNQVNEIRAADLSFNLDEISSFFCEIMELKLEDREVSIMELKTEGWIAGLQLAGLSLKGNENISGFIEDFAGNNRHVVDYLAEEVLNRLPDHIQIFLFQTSILNRFCGEVCDFITERTDSRKILAELERANLFLIPLDDKRLWYRYHHLFGELMRQRLVEKHADSINDLHLKASQWFEKKGSMEDSINHAFGAANYIRAASLIEKYIETHWQEGERVSLYGWLNEIPEAIVHTRPNIQVTKARVLFERGLHEKARENLDLLDSALNSPDQVRDGITQKEIKVIQGKAAAIRSHMNSREGKIKGIEAFIEDAFDLLPKEEASSRAVVSLSSGIVQNIKGDYAAALKAHSQAMAKASEAGNEYLFLIARLWKILDLKNIGRLPEAISICKKLLKEVESGKLSFFVAIGHVKGAWGELIYELNRLEEAESFEREGVERLEKGYDINHLAWRLTILFKILCSRQKIKESRKLVLRMEDLMETKRISPWIATQMRAARAKIWVIEGNQAALSQWIIDCGLKVDGEFTVLQEAENLMYARILMDQGRFEDSLHITDSLIEVQEKASRVLSQIETLIIKSIILQKMQRKADSIHALLQALTLAQPGGYLRVFVDEGRPLAEIIETIGNFDSEPLKELVRKLLVEFKTIKHVIRSENLIEPLSDRELEVLRLLSAGLSNKKMTDELFISTNTVKTHLKNIYGKLAVHSRAEAIIKAQELKLL